MSNQEANKISVLDRLKLKEIKQKQASEILGLSIRQVRRLAKNYQKIGIISLVHGNRGRHSNHRVDNQAIDKVLELIKLKYADFGPTLVHEKLSETREISLPKLLGVN